VPGELVGLDTFYIGGQFKGVGKVWQISACDAACSYGVAWLLPAHTAQAAAHFLRRIVLPLYRRAGWRLRRVLTDGGPEFHEPSMSPVGRSASATPGRSPACLDQWVRRAAARHAPAGALARGLPSALLHTIPGLDSLGLSQPTLNRLENAGQNTTLRTLTQLCQALGCDVGDLFRRGLPFRRAGDRTRRRT
jgi:hypothetical protein